MVFQADMYEGFKCVHFEAEWCSPDGPTGLIVAFRPMLLLDTTPVSAGETSLIDRMAMTWPTQTTPERLKLSARELAGEKPFYDTTDPNDHPGIIVISAPADDGIAQVTDFTLKLTYKFLFYGPVDPANTIARIKREIAEAMKSEGEIQLIDESDSDPVPRLAVHRKSTTRPKVVTCLTRR
jgi:hypothetical protein